MNTLLTRCRNMPKQCSVRRPFAVNTKVFYSGTGLTLILGMTAETSCSSDGSTDPFDMLYLVKVAAVGVGLYGIYTLGAPSQFGQGTTTETAARPSIDACRLTGFVGPALLTPGLNSKTTAQCLQGKEIVLLYFSAHWCPPCRHFTPQLAQCYENGPKEKAEVIFLSADRTEDMFHEYFSDMPWTAVPFSDRERKEALMTKFGVKTYPSLIVSQPLPS